MSDTETHSRRQVIRGAGVVGATVAGIGAGSAPTAAQNETEDGGSCDPEESVECSYGGEPDYGVSYLVGRVKEHFTGFGSEEDYKQAEARSLYLRARGDAEIIKSANNSVLTSVENLAQNAKVVAYQLARATFLEALNNEDPAVEALDKAKTRITEYVAPNQKNLHERWEVMMEQIKTQIDRASSTPGIGSGNLWRIQHFYDPIGTSGIGGKIETASVSFVDGTSKDFRYIHFARFVDYTTAGAYPYPTGKDYISQQPVYFAGDSQTSDGSISDVLQPQRFGELHNELSRIHNEAQREIESFYNGIKDQYQAGDISTEDITTPQDLWSMSSSDAETPYAAADLAGLGLQVNQASSVTVDLLDDGVLLDGSVYLSESPIGESLSVGTVYDPTQSVDTDSDGNPVDYEGTVDDPVPLDGLTYIAYNKSDGGSTYSKIQQPFEVVDAIGEDGETLDEVGYEPAGGQQTTTTDIDKLKKELKAMNEEVRRLEKEQREIAGGGGLLGDIGENVSGQTVAGVIVVLLALAGLGGGGS